jgi:tRNA pseudouridine13 synthase
MSEASERVPHEPLIASLDLPAAGGTIGPEPEDFVVDELALHPPAAEGAHLLVRLRKRLWTTHDMLRAVARAAGVRERDMGSAGMKDKQGVTSQWISLPESALPPERWELPAGIEVMESARTPRKLRTGQLRGNRFRIRLVGVPEAGVARARAICERLSARGLPNYFGAQRFGRDRENLALAVDFLEGRAGARSRFLNKLYPSVVQSEIFNRYVSLRLAAGLETLLEGEVVRLDGSASVFVVENPQREQPRLVSGDIHPTGPMLGPKMRRAASTALELEERAAASLALSGAARERLDQLVDGTRRDVVVRPEALSVSAENADRLVLEFSLPAGSYATQLIRELTRNAAGVYSRA